MSDPKIWNGTAWVRPRFWDGARWREYIPPVYDDPALLDTFTSGSDGWHHASGGPESGWTADEGGYIFNSNPPGFLSGMYMGTNEGTHPIEDLTPAIGHHVRLEILTRFRTLQGGPFSGELMSWDFGVGGARYRQTDKPEEFINFGAAGWDSGWYWRNVTSDTPITAPDWIGWQAPFVDLGVYTGPIGDPFIGWWAIAEARMVDVTTGQPLMDLGDPGWQPRVWTGAQWR